MGDRVSPLAGCLCSYSNESRRRKVPWFFLSFHFLLVLVQSVNWLEFSAWRKVRGRDLRSMWVCLDRLARKKKKEFIIGPPCSNSTCFLGTSYWLFTVSVWREDARRLINRKQMAGLLDGLTDRRELNDKVGMKNNARVGEDRSQNSRKGLPLSDGASSLSYRLGRSVDLVTTQ